MEDWMLGPSRLLPLVREVNWAHPLARGLVLALLPEAGSPWRDVTRNGRSATLTGNPMWVPADIGGHALSTDGSTQYATIADHSDLRPDSLSYSVFLLSRMSATSGYVVSKGNKFSTNRGWAILPSGSQYQVRCNASNDTTQRASQTSPSSAKSANSRLQSVGMVINREAGVITGYSNGSNNGWTAGGGGPTSDSITGFGAINDTNAIKIAVASDDTSPTALEMGCLFIWRRGLAPQEMMALHINPFAFLSKDAREIPAWSGGWGVPGSLEGVVAQATAESAVASLFGAASFAAVVATADGDALVAVLRSGAILSSALAEATAEAYAAALTGGAYIVGGLAAATAAALAADLLGDFPGMYGNLAQSSGEALASILRGGASLAGSVASTSAGANPSMLTGAAILPAGAVTALAQSIACSINGGAIIQALVSGANASALVAVIQSDSMGTPRLIITTAGALLDRLRMGTDVEGNMQGGGVG